MLKKQSKKIMSLIFGMLIMGFQVCRVDAHHKSLREYMNMAYRYNLNLAPFCEFLLKLQKKGMIDLVTSDTADPNGEELHRKYVEYRCEQYAGLLEEEVDSEVTELESQWTGCNATDHREFISIDHCEDFNYYRDIKIRNPYAFFLMLMQGPGNMFVQAVNELKTNFERFQDISKYQFSNVNIIVDVSTLFSPDFVNASKFAFYNNFGIDPIITVVVGSDYWDKQKGTFSVEFIKEFKTIYGGTITSFKVKYLIVNDNANEIRNKLSDINREMCDHRYFI